MSADATPLLIPLCSAEDAESFGALRVEPDGYAPLAVFHSNGEFFVTDDTCSHGAASLSEGVVQDGKVECPWHSGSFCLKTGEPLTFPASAPIRIYASKVQGGQICIAAPASHKEIET